MKQLVTLDMFDAPLYEGDIVITEYGRVCKIVWRQTCAIIGYDLEPIGNFQYQAPSKENCWNPAYLIKITHSENHYVEKLINEYLNGGKYDEYYKKYV